MQSETQGVRRQCFSLVQSRRFGVPIDPFTLALCPSMDLLALSLQQHRPDEKSSTMGYSIPPLWLHRSLSFQKLATITNDIDDEEDVMENVEDETGSSTTTSSCNIASVWRPDGRWLAVTDSKGRLSLFHVEALVKEANISTSTVFPSLSSSVSSFQSSKLKASQYCYKTVLSGNAVRIQICSRNTSVCGLHWSHIGEWHPLLHRQDVQEIEAEDDDGEEMQNVSHLFAKVRQRYTDRSSMLLPASDYYPEYVRGVFGSSNTSHFHAPSTFIAPTGKTPLSLLVVALSDGTMECYLNGRYHIASGLHFKTPSRGPVSRVQMACSNDLCHVLVLAQRSVPTFSDMTSNLEEKTCDTSCCYSLFSVPTMAEQRYTMQTLTALYSSMMGHLQALPSLLTDVLESWKSSLKPLDTKLESLSRLLRNYGILSEPTNENGEPVPGTSSTISQIRRHLVRYILSGHTSSSADLSNAMDQFFTGVQMNDKLIERMERSQTVAIANVESLLRKTIAAVRALTIESDQLHGLARSSNGLIPAKAAGDLQESCQKLLIVMESSLTSLVDGRFRFRDWIAWLRATGSQIKARGTAANSVQKENAKKRRVPDATTRRILRYLQQDEAGTDMGRLAPETEELSVVNGISSSEMLLGIDVSHHWNAVDRPRPSSPHSVLMGDTSRTAALSSIPQSYQSAAEAAHHLFELPLKSMKPCFRRFDFELATNDHDDATAITTRLGAGGLSVDGWSFGEGPPTGFFDPHIICNDASSEDSGRACRQWALSSQSRGSGMEQDESCCVIEIRAVPLPWYTVSLEHRWDDENRNLNTNFEFFLGANLQFPQGYKVHELAFYGDNGKSGLFTENTACTERRQALTALVGKETDQGYALELWLIDYDQARWTKGRLSRKKGRDFDTVSFETTTSMFCNQLICLEKGDDEDDEEEEEEENVGFIRCKTRELRKFSSTAEASSARLVLSGSRGIAAVLSSEVSPARSHIIEVLDLEEDEDDDEEDESMEGSE